MLNQIKSRVMSYKTLYILCFMGINLIEFLKASQTGDIWHVAVNCTGLIMMIIVASAYRVREMFDRFAVIYSLANVVAMIAVYVHWMGHRGTYNVWQRETAVMNVWWLGIVLRHMFHKIFEEKKLKLQVNFTGAVWVLMSLFMIISVSGYIWPLWYLVMFGGFYLTQYTKEQGIALREGMIDGTIISFFGIQIYAYGFRPYDTVRYVGAFGNCNAMALYYLMVYCMLLFKFQTLHQKKAKLGVKLFFLIGAGGMLCFQMFTLCRTAWVVSAFITLLYAIWVMRGNWKLSFGGIFLRACGLGLAVVLTFLPVYGTIRYLPTILHYRIWYSGEYDVNKVHSFDPYNSWKYVSLDEYLEAAVGRIYTTLSGKQVEQEPVETVEEIENTADALLENQVENQEVEEKEERPDIAGLERVPLVNPGFTTDESTLIRLTIYKVYLRDMKWFGNKPGSGFYVIGDGNYKSWHAQNFWIQVGYTFGIFAGILSILLTVSLFVSHGKKMRKQPEKHYLMIPMMITIVFFMFGLTEIVWNLGQMIMFLMFFVQHPGIFELEDECAN